METEPIKKLVHTLLPNVTLQPIGIPSRSRKPAIDFRARVTMGFCPANLCQGGRRVLDVFLLRRGRLPTPILTTIFDSRGKESRFLRPGSLPMPARSPTSYFSCNRGFAAAFAIFAYPLVPRHLTDF